MTRLPVFFVLILLASFSNAELIDNGDVTLDTTTGLEWLDLTLTLGQSYNDIVIGGFGGYAAAGFRHATTNEICGLFGSLGDPVSGCLSDVVIFTQTITQVSADTLTGLLGVTAPLFGVVGTYGVYDSGTVDMDRGGVGCIDAGTGSNCFGGVILPFVVRSTGAIPLDDNRRQNFGNWLVRESVVPVLQIAIDIKPGSDPNCFNINGHGVIPVAVLGSDSLNVLDIDTSALFFAGLEVRMRGKKGPMCHGEDFNGDEFLDLVCQFEDDTSMWTPDSSSEATLAGTLFDGTEFEGSDSICVK